MRLAIAPSRRAIAPLPCAAMAMIALVGSSAAEERTPPMRVRLSYASEQPRAWDAIAQINSGSIEGVQPLSIDPNQTGAVYEENSALVLHHHEPVRRGVVDFDVSGDADGVLRVQLSADAAAPNTAELNLADVRAGDAAVWETAGLRLVARRGPSDRMRIDWPYDNVVFEPGAELAFAVWADPPPAEAATQLEMNVVLLRTGDRDGASDGDNDDAGVEAWRSEPSRFEHAGEASRIALGVPLPDAEGVYEVRVTVREPPGFSRRFFPRSDPRPLLERRFQVAVLDRSPPPAALPVELEGWTPIPQEPSAEPRIRDRLSDWSKWPRTAWQGEPPTEGESAIGLDAGVTLPAAPRPNVASWARRRLAVAKPGEACLVEVTVPNTTGQLLGVSLHEPNARGVVRTIGKPVIASTSPWANPEDETTLRYVFWPNTATPTLVLNNPNTDRGARATAIRVLQPSSDFAGPADAAAGDRLIALDLRSDDPLGDFNAPLAHDAASGVSYPDVRSWTTVARRMAELVELQGAGGAVVAMNTAEGAFYATNTLAAAPTHDRGVWIDGANDLPRRPWVDLLSQEFQRRGLHLIPAIDLGGRLPAAERQATDRTAGALARSSLTGATEACRYNPLSEAVSAACVAACEELAHIGASRAAWKGVAVTLDERSALVLDAAGPVGFDQPTVDRFLQTINVVWPEGAARSPEAHAAAIEQQARQEWEAWRRSKMAATHQRVAGVVGRAGQGAERWPTYWLVDRLADAPLLRGRYAQPPGAAPTAGPAGSLTLPKTSGTLLTPAPYHDPVAGPPVAMASRQATDRVRAATGATTSGAILHGARMRIGFDPALGEPPIAQLLAFQLVSADLESGAMGSFATSSVVIDGGAAASGLFFPEEARVRRRLSVLPIASTDAAGAQLADNGVRVALVGGEGEATLVASNTSVWPREARISIAADARTSFAEIAAGGGASGAEWCSPGGHVIGARLRPGEVRAWRFSSVEVALTGLRLREEPEAERTLSERLQAFRSRDRTVRRVYDAVPNPSFEVTNEAGGLVGWTTPDAPLGPSNGPAHDGERSLRLTANPASAVAATSDWFAAPATGQFALFLQARASGLDERSTLQIEFEQRDGAVTSRSIRGADLFADWREVVFAVDDLPLDRPPMRLRFRLVAESGSVEIDSVSAEDLMLPLAYYADETRGQKFALVKMTHDAEAALAEGRLDDCRRLLDSYWPRFIMENFPAATEPAESLAPPDTGVAEEEQQADAEPQSVADRVRSYLPSWWR